MHTSGAKAKEIEQDLGCGGTAPAIFRAEGVDEGDYEAVISLLKTYGYRGFDWRSDTRTLTATLTTRIHGAGCRLMADVQKALAAFGIQDDGTYYDITNNVAIRLNGGGSVRKKGADMGFVPLDMNAEPISEYPTLAIQVGFAQTIESLREEAESFLQDSRGEIKIVLLVKFEYRADAFDLPAASWIEAWRRNDAGGVYKATSVIIHPPPPQPDTQYLRLELDDVYPTRPQNLAGLQLSVGLNLLRASIKTQIKQMQLELTAAE